MIQRFRWVVSVNSIITVLISQIQTDLGSKLVPISFLFRKNYFIHVYTNSFTNSSLYYYILLKPITKTLVNVSSPRGPPTALLPLTLCFWGCKKQLKAPPVSPFFLPSLLGNWKPLSIGAGARPHLQLIFHTAALKL